MAAIKLTPEQRKDFEYAAQETYQQCGYDLGWHDRTPTKGEFADTICDLIHTRLTRSQEQLWNSLSIGQRQTIARKVGP